MKTAGRLPTNALVIIFLVSCLVIANAQSPSPVIQVFRIDASAPPPQIESGYLNLGGKLAGNSLDGHVLSVNNRYLVMDGKPWLPVMGEFHYSRYPERYWEEEILKMKAGGIQIISTYVFWIHHEEVEGQFDWSGQRDLRKFVTLCARHGMYVYPRIGPWGHGEVRNGGFPDWLAAKGPTRVNEPAYLDYVARYFAEVSRQLKGLLWKDGGPVIGIQIENEYSNRTANGGAAYISKLKRMAIDSGIDVPLYTVTGWDNAVYPEREVIPVFGGYPDEPWSGSLQKLSPDTQGVYQFHTQPNSGATGILQGVTAPSGITELSHYPRFTAELGGGTQLTYHRRVQLGENDIAPMAITSLGSGVNLLGYYMFQGGANPRGKFTTLQESQATDYPNDVPVVSYDFQAPLGQYGQMNASFRKLKLIHQFIHDFGAGLASMTAVLPDVRPSGPADVTTLRVAARTSGNHGFIFFNNYLRNYPLPGQRNVQIDLKMQSEEITVPAHPINVPSQSAFFWPVNFDLDGVLLKYSTAQPFARIEDGNVTYYFFAASKGILAEFAFDESTMTALKSHLGIDARESGRVYVTAVKPSLAAAVDIQTRAGKSIRIVLLSPEQAENSWKVTIRGKDHLLITKADLFSDQESIHLRSREINAFEFSIVPGARNVLIANTPLKEDADSKDFSHHSLTVQETRVHAGVEKVRDALPSSPVKMGQLFEWRSGPVAETPDDSEFSKACIWQLNVSKAITVNVDDVFLDVSYVGDIGRMYRGEDLVDDNFFNGTPWEVGLKRFGTTDLAKSLKLEILPLRKDAPIYLPADSWPDFGAKSELCEVQSIKAYAEYQVRLTPAPRSGSSAER